MADIVIIGAGVAGTIAAAILHRRGNSVTLVDARDPCESVFKCEVLGLDQVDRLRRLGFLDPVLEHATLVKSVSSAWMGVNLHTGSTEHYGILYHDLVNALRRQLPAELDFRVARVLSISSSGPRRRVVLDNGQELNPRLVVMASGHSQSLFGQLGITRDMRSASHSFALGVTIEPENADTFPFEELTYWGDKDDSDIAMATFFPVDGRMRLNVFAYWNADDPRVRAFSATPELELFRLMPGLREVTGALRVVSKVDRYAINLHCLTGHILPGIVAIGDAYSVVCPATGTGLTKVLNDVEILTGKYVSDWIASDNVGERQIAAFYGDRRKVRVDQRSFNLSVRMRRTAMDDALPWRLRRSIRRVKRSLLRTGARWIEKIA